ncbi:MAG: DUF3307 domain-containing protein [Solirubrobacteraceae bacterium]|jgi:hypothetical protein
MPWIDVFAVLIVSHLVGDYMLQTDWQALHKRGALTGTPEMRRALVSHVTTYTAAFVPSFVWLYGSLHLWVLVLAASIAVPHLIQDDGQLLAAYARRVKKADIKANVSLGAALDQSFHMLALFLVALVAGH